MSSKASIKELSIRAGGVRRLLNIEQMLSQGRSLEALVVGCRSLIDDPTTVFKLTVPKFTSIIAPCLRLWYLRVAVDVGDPQSRSAWYERTKFLVRRRRYRATYLDEC